MIRYTLPYPPSLNGLFANAGKGRVKSASYKAWRKEAAAEISAQRAKQPKSIKGKVSLHIALVRPDNRKRDLTNAAFKAVEDVLVEMGVIEDDSLVERVSAQWITDGPACVVLVQPYVESIAA